jgi:bifunctional DNA-binding transcriptional regulator/antitoxin component of YhaV-PrlF toxin-antitoxin module
MSYLRLTEVGTMEKTKLSSKGQVVLPRAVRVAKSWRAGQLLAVVSTDEGVLLTPLNRFASASLDEVVGCLRHEGKAKSIEEMDAAVAREARRRRK